MARVKLSVKVLLFAGLFVVKGLTISKGFLDGMPSFVIKGLRVTFSLWYPHQGSRDRISLVQNIIAANIQTKVFFGTCQYSPSAINRAINFTKPKMLLSLNSPFVPDILAVPPPDLVHSCTVVTRGAPHVKIHALYAESHSTPCSIAPASAGK